jgi:N-acyl-L-homoserine lactone synthetase
MRRPIQFHLDATLIICNPEFVIAGEEGMQVAFTDSIASAREELVVEIARTADQIIEAKRLRFRVYCQERGFEPCQGDIEQDEFDAQSRHVLVRSRLTGDVYGTVRVALSCRDHALPQFPMERLCQSWVFAPLPRWQTGEVSRFALTRDRAGLSPGAAALMRLCLFKGIIQVSGEEGLTDLCALMEKTLLRLLQVTSVYFRPVGPTVEHRGIRQPAVWAIGNGLARMRRENNVVWSFITSNGTLWSEEIAANRIAA